MARGQQKIQSQQKNAERQAKVKKAQSSKRAENKALVYSCTVCKVSIFFLSFFEKKSKLMVALWHFLYGQVSEISVNLLKVIFTKN